MSKSASKGLDLGGRPVWLGVILVPILLYAGGAVAYLSKQYLTKLSKRLLAKFDPVKLSKDFISRVMYQFLEGLLGSLFYISLTLSSFFITKTHVAEACILGTQQVYYLVFGVIIYTESFQVVEASAVKFDYLLKDLFFAGALGIALGVWLVLGQMSWPLATCLLGLYVLFLLIESVYSTLRQMVISFLDLETKDEFDLEEERQQLNLLPGAEDLAQYFDRQRFELLYSQAQQKAEKIMDAQKRNLYLKLSSLYFRVLVCRQSQAAYQKDKVAVFHSKQFGNNTRKERFHIKHREKKVESPVAKCAPEQRVPHAELVNFCLYFDKAYIWLHWLRQIHEDFAYLLSVVIVVGLGVAIDISAVVCAEATKLSPAFVGILPAVGLGLGLLLESNVQTPLPVCLQQINRSFIFKLGTLVGFCYLVSGLTGGGLATTVQIPVFCLSLLVTGTITTGVVSMNLAWPFLVTFTASLGVIVFLAISLVYSKFS